MTDYTQAYKSTAEQFRLEGKVKEIAPYGEGHINLTMLVTTDKKRYIMQKMNTNVFPDPDSLMKNICGVTEHLRRLGKETLTVVSTADGKSFLRQTAAEKQDGGKEACFRVYDFIEHTVTYQKVTDGKVFYNSGKAFGEFQNDLASFDASRLTETIPRFHDTPKRFADFLQAAEADKCSRAAECVKEIDFLMRHKDTFSLAVEGLKDGSLPLRVTHNDTKLNNILMDEKTNEARAVIDLDTVMPGSMLYDFGDSIRFGANPAAEDEKDLSKVRFDLGLFESYARGYCGAVRASIAPREKELLPYGAYLMTAECGMRFLTDYLSGDTYFATKYAGQNLDRCRTQLCLAEQIEEKIPLLQKIVAAALE